MDSSYTSSVSYSIRDVHEDDLAAVLLLNEASTPAVSSVSLEKMQWFKQDAAYFRVCMQEGYLGAFLIGMRSGSTYDSPNYQWFCSNYVDFGYIDRVAVDTRARRLGLATRLYEDFRASLPKSIAVMTCEVNIEPPNESSMRFHRHLGFRQVGAQTTEDGKKQVAYLERRL